MTLDAADVAAVCATLLPELPDAKQRRFEREYGLTPYEANLLTETRRAGGLLRSGGRAAAARGRPRYAEAGGELDARRPRAASARRGHGHRRCQGIAGDLLCYDRRCSRRERSPGKIAKSVFEEMFRSGKAPADIVQELGLEADQRAGRDRRRSSTKVIEANPKPVEDYRAGKQEAIKFLVGQAMRETRGRANPADAHRDLEGEDWKRTA